MERFWFDCPNCHDTTCMKADSITGRENFKCESCHAIVGVRLFIVEYADNHDAEYDNILERPL